MRGQMSEERGAGQGRRGNLAGWGARGGGAFTPRNSIIGNLTKMEDCALGLRCGGSHRQVEFEPFKMLQPPAAELLLKAHEARVKARPQDYNDGRVYVGVCAAVSGGRQAGGRVCAQCTLQRHV